MPPGSPPGCCSPPLPKHPAGCSPNPRFFSQSGLEVNAGRGCKRKKGAPLHPPNPLHAAGGSQKSQAGGPEGAKPKPGWSGGSPQADLGTPPRAEVVPVVPPRTLPARPHRWYFPSVPPLSPLPASAVFPKPSTGPDGKPDQWAPVFPVGSTGREGPDGEDMPSLRWWWQRENLAPGGRQNS